jgi:putative phage-type endonuclease
MQQRSPEWFMARAGKVTASRVQDILAKTKTGASASRGNYLAQLVAERLTGQPAESLQTAAMQWGTEQESFARAAYEAATGVIVTDTGFVIHPQIEQAGASPDGLVGDDGLVEIKCPNTATHIDTLINKTIPAKYHSQMQWQMTCTGRQWCDFVSFDPRMPEELRLFVKRIKADQDFISTTENEVLIFLAEVDSTVSKLMEIKNGI